MKYLQIKEQLLNEINMSPSGLRRAAKDIGARAGMEFEMIVPGAAESEEGDDYQEPDYDSDESIRSIQDAYDFFYDGDFNGRRDVERLRDQMTEQYHEWLSEKVDEKWEEDKDGAIYDWLRYNAAPSQVFEILGVEEDKNGNFPDPKKEDYINAAAKVVEDQISPWYEEAEEDFRDNFYRDADMEGEWLEDNNIHSMQDVESNYNITWPHYYNPDTSGGDVSIEDAADSFSRAIGREVQASQNYHSRSVTRPSATELHYVVEPDGSLSADDDNDGGLEFVSPALPIDELLSDLKKVKAWADKTGCYTNDSTGLHINVSVPAWQGDLSKLDYVKLAILMGDEYVLENFGRAGNTYAKSALKIVKDNIRQRPEDVKRLLDTMKEHLNTSAAKLIHSGSTNKYTSVNTKDGYIEFRSPGGDWLNENFDKIESTLLRFVVAMDAAVDETKYKDEYAKKLYKLLVGNDKDSTNTLAYFAKYAAGEMPAAALKSFIKQAQFERSAGKEPNGKKMWYRVDKEGRGQSGASVEVVARSKEEALEKAASEWMVRLSSLTAADAYPVRAYEEPKIGPSNPDGNYIISKFRADGPNTVAYRFSADTLNDAEMVLYDWLKANNIVDRPDPVRGIIKQYSVRYDPTKAEGQPAGEQAGGQSSQRYEIYNKQTGNTVEDAPDRVTSDEQALVHLRDYIEHGPHGLQNRQASDMFGIRRHGTTQPIQQPAQAREPESRFEIYRISDGRTVEHNGQPLYVNARGVDDADERARQIIAAANLGAPQLFGVRSVLQAPAQSTPRPVLGVTDIEPDISTGSPVRGSTQDLQQQRAQGGFTGAWKVLDGLGREVYRFSGIGNNQSDANRVAADWMRQNGRGGNFEVVPVMG